ncbi:MAG TPA: pantoate--beta-alanine ligase, partial [Gammaproteobacteria bacterium]|nr:pantoate--beta-alanine ligase [Gammaproteobacteria bacterium]
LRLPVSVIRCPIQRESDGLAMSSRNRYLTAKQRLRAGALYATLQHVRSALQNGIADYQEIEGQAMSMLAEAGFRPDYVEVRRAADLTKARENDRPDQLVILAAAWLGRARLIDNVLV